MTYHFDHSAFESLAPGGDEDPAGPRLAASSTWSTVKSARSCPQPVPSRSAALGVVRELKVKKARPRRHAYHPPSRTPNERDAHEAGLVTVHPNHHNAVDALGLDSESGTPDLTRDPLLERPVRLSTTRASDEAQVHIHSLRSDYQNPTSPALNLTASTRCPLEFTCATAPFMKVPV
jgi:hypothetical protein